MQSVLKILLPQRLRLCAVLVAGVLVSGSATAQDAPKYLALEHGTTYVLTAAGGALSTRLPVRAEPKNNLADLDATVSDVIVDGRHDAALLACISATEDFDKAAAPALVLRVTCAHTRPDDYDVTVTITTRAVAKGAAAAETAGGTAKSAAPPVEPAPQKLAVKLTRPVPVLRAIAAQEVEQTIYPQRPSSLTPSRLIISESSRRTLPLTFSARQVDPPTLGGRAVAGKLEFKDATTDANGHAELGVSIVEAFPLGQAKTMVEIKSPDLAAPIYVVYEVATRLHVIHLIVAIVIGLSLGYLTRTVLTNFIERRRARDAGQDLLDKMKSARTRFNETEFRTAVDGLTDTLRRKLRTRDPQVLKTAVEQADSAFTTAETALKASVAALNDAIDSTVALTRAAAKYPNRIATVLEKARRELASAQGRVLQGDVEAGRTKAAEATAVLATTLQRTAAGWRNDVEAGLTAVEGLTRLPAGLRASLTTALTTIRGHIGKFPAPDAHPEIVPILNAVHAVSFLADHDIGGRILTPLAGEAQQVLALLSKAEIPADSIAARTTELLASFTHDGDTTLEAPAKAARLLLEALREDLTEAAKTSGVDVGEELAAGRYVDAATRITIPKRDVVDSSTERADRKLLVPMVPAIVPLLAFPATFSFGAPFGGGNRVEISRARGVLEIALAQGAQFLIASAGITIVGLLMLGPTFDGTWRGVFGALLWGYAGDISIAALTDAAKKVK